MSRRVLEAYQIQHVMTVQVIIGRPYNVKHVKMRRDADEVVRQVSKVVSKLRPAEVGNRQ